MGLRDRIAAALQPPAPVERADAPAHLLGLRHHVDSIVNALTGLGGDNDQGRAGRPRTLLDLLDYNELTALYRTNHYARKFIDKIPEDGTRAGWRVLGADEEADEDLLKDETADLKVPHHFCEANRWARLYGGAVIFMVLDEDIPAEFRQPGMASAWLQQPVDPARVKSVVNLVVLERNEATAQSWVTDTRDPEHGQPDMWQLNPNQMVKGLRNGAIVHRSRLLYFPGAQLPPALKKGGDGHDDSVVQAAWQAISGKTSVDQAGNVLAQEIKVDVVRVAGKAAMSLSDDDESELLTTKMALIAKSKSLLNLILLGPDDEYETRSTVVTGWKELDEQKRIELAAAFGWPQTVIFGDPPGGLNTDGQSHKDLWANLVAAWQGTHLRDNLVKLYDLIWAASGEAPESWDIEFYPIELPSDAERAATRKAVAETDAIYLDRGVLDPVGLAEGRFGKRGWQLDLPAQAVPEPVEEPTAEEMAAAMAEAEAEAEAVAEADKGDTAGACWVGLALGPTMAQRIAVLRDMASHVTGQELDDKGDPPHVTLLYLGASPNPSEVVDLAGDVLARARPIEMVAESVGTFPATPQSDGLVPVVVLLDRWGLGELRVELMEALAHQVASPQHRGYRPHITLGYARGPLTAEQALALAELSVEGIRGLGTVAHVNAAGQSE